MTGADRADHAERGRVPADGRRATCDGSRVRKSRPLRVVFLAGPDQRLPLDNTRVIYIEIHSVSPFPVSTGAVNFFNACTARSLRSFSIETSA